MVYATEIVGPSGCRSSFSSQTRNFSDGFSLFYFFYFSLVSLFSSRYLRVSFVQRIVRSVSRRCLEFRTSIVERRNVRFDSREFQLRFTDPATMFAHFVTSFSYERCAESLKCLDSVRLSSRALYTTLLYSIRARHHFRLMELPLRGNRRGNWPLRHRR